MVTKISKWFRIQDSCRITPKIESLVVYAMFDIPSKFQKDPSIIFRVIAWTHRQTNKQTNKVWQKHYLLGGGNNLCGGVVDIAEVVGRLSARRQQLWSRLETTDAAARISCSRRLMMIVRWRRRCATVAIDRTCFVAAVHALILGLLPLLQLLQVHLNLLHWNLHIHTRATASSIRNLKKQEASCNFFLQTAANLRQRELWLPSQSFNFASKFPESEKSLSPYFVLTEEKFPTKRKFPTG